MLVKEVFFSNFLIRESCIFFIYSSFKISPNIKKKKRSLFETSYHKILNELTNQSEYIRHQSIIEITTF